ncbi:MSMEG_0568 family radical SAM protein [Solirubrobacter ginsenosidimutans]|uniref:MSMEG_0568 family radical SAM protein n=1 Tax=Solirubrobacter ginsenosidimutans TaxID=490573 RepID=A0A9X3RYZ7_9ACTN|nr:MSMEG_0568 family radical SAM protein [Solirubrobacter ginsenosidimutans]MDA0159674.1 MSMEG_0568 family radical SAM protein [Solirubrobacter ginsenosidimutans]
MPEPVRLSLDDRQLLVELQSLGVRVEDATDGPLPGRLGGAGPSDALFLWVRGLPLTVPSHASYVDASPYTVRVEGKRATLFRDDELVGPVTLPPRPRIYDMQTADGVPYWKIALLHLDSIASTVVQKCIYWDTPEQCGFCGIELTRGEQTIPVKTPAQLAEVCTAARDYDHAVDVTLTTGSLNRRDRGAIYISRCASAIKEASGLPIQVQFEPPDDLRVLDEVARAGVDAVGIHSETFDPEVLARVAPGKAQCGIEGYFRTWERAVDVFGRGSVTTYVLLGMGEREELIIEGCRRAIAMGVYPFVVPLRPVPGTLMADSPTPDPDYVGRVYGEVAAMLSEAGFDHLDAKAGCARCQACSGLSAWERVMRREDGADLDDLFVGAHG